MADGGASYSFALCYAASEEEERRAKSEEVHSRQAAARISLCSRVSFPSVHSHLPMRARPLLLLSLTPLPRRYATTPTLNTYSALIHDFYARECGVHPAVHLTVDTEVSKGEVGVKAWTS